MAQDKLTGFKCKRCGTIAYPRRFLCSSCKGKNFEECPLPDDGKIVTFTKLWAIPEGIEQLPLTLAIVEFDNQVRITGQVLNEEISIGDRVRPVWGHIRKIRGKEIQGFRFERLP